MAHDCQEEILIRGDQYSALLARLAVIERDINALMVWAENCAKCTNLPPPAWSGRIPMRVNQSSTLSSSRTDS